MNWDAIGAIAELVGAIGVVATLIFLALQVRQSKEATEANTKALDETRRLASAQAYQNRSAEFERNAAEAVANSPYLPAIELKYHEGGLNSLTDEEALRLRQATAGSIARLDNIHYQYQQGFIDDEFYNSAFTQAVELLADKLKDFDIAVGSRPSFKAEIERIIGAASE